jgi:hypothetical protein
LIVKKNKKPQLDIPSTPQSHSHHRLPFTQQPKPKPTPQHRRPPPIDDNENITEEDDRDIRHLIQDPVCVK